MKYRPKCGRELDDEMSSCPYCADNEINPNVKAEETPTAEALNCTPEESAKAPVRKVDIKKIAVTAASVLLVIGLIIACVLIFKPDPNDVVQDAYDMTVDQFSDVFAKAEGFEAMSSVLADIQSADKLSMQLNLTGEQFELTSDGSEVNVSLDMTANVDVENEIVAGDIYLATHNHIGADEPDDLNLLYSITTDGLMFKLSDHVDKTYGVAIDENIFDRIIDSYIYRNTSLCQTYPAVMLRMMSSELKNSDALSGGTVDDSANELGYAYDRFVSTLEYAESNKDVPMFDGLDVYGIAYDEDALSDFAEILIDAMESSNVYYFSEEVYDFMEALADGLGDGSIELYLGINGEGYLSAFSMYTGDEYYSIVLEGKENIWESFGFYIDDELLISGGFKQTKSGFQLRIGTVSVSYNDKAGKLTLKVASSSLGEIAIPFYFDVLDDGKGVSFKLDLSDFGLSMSYTMRELKDDVSVLDTSFTDILDFDEAAFNEFMLLFADDTLAGSLFSSSDDSFEYENVFGDPDIDYYD